ncbi:MAG: hypothetical protein ACYDBP_02705 [Leptospirales bacterium]
MEKNPIGEKESSLFAPPPLRWGRGRLKIYLGWAPGTGKTRRALLDLLAMKSRGVDVAIGWLEEKERPEIDAIASGLERIPPKTTLRGGVPIAEVDIEAVRSRRPTTLFVDELARGAKEEGEEPWQVIDSLLDFGISVVTTVNALHISELAGACAQVLGHPVREIVPVEFIRRADELVVVDIPPAELAARIREGRVFPAEERSLALSHAFSEQNLVRLREIALQFAGKLLDRQLIRQGGEKGLFERVTVLVSGNPETFRILLEYGGTMARRLGGELLVLHLEKIPLWGRLFSSEPSLPEELRKATVAAGGKLSLLRSRNLAFSLWRFVQRTRTTRLVLGHAGDLYPWRKSLVRSILRHFSRIDVEINLVPTLHAVSPEFAPTTTEREDTTVKQGESRGRFTLFLGAAAGIGKTYRMLQTAKEKQGEGRRVLVGYLETHGRRETEEMSRDLPAFPRKRVPYRGLLLEEMDLEGILSAAPEIVLVDELAHTNPPGFASKKRYQDTLRLLSAGIDVYSTLNVQHIESLNDLVELQTGIRVRETVPDRIVAMADDLVLVDLTPEELQKRLLEGKVYPPEKVEMSLENFFTTKNLTALREFAFSSAAAPGGPSGFMAARGGAIVVGVSQRPEDLALVRRGARLADRLRLRLVALSIRTDEEDGRNASADIATLVRELGGDFLTEFASSWEAHFISRCLEIRPALVLLGQSAFRPKSESTAEKIARRLTSFPMLIVPLNIKDHSKESTALP